MTKIKLIFYNTLPIDPILNTNNEYAKTKTDSINNSQRRASSVIAYNLLDTMLHESNYPGLDACSIAENEYGKPYFTDSNLYFNISHSKNAVMCAISEHPIGVDIEYIGDIKPLMLKRYFGQREIEQISDNTDFYKLWTLKEAYVKAHGIGISKDISHINFELKNKIICFDNEVQAIQNFFTNTDYGYAYSLCSEEIIYNNDIKIEKV